MKRGKNRGEGKNECQKTAEEDILIDSNHILVN